MRLHLIETHNAIHPIERASRRFTSGDWRISAAQAQTLIGHEVFFHKHQCSLSHFGGRITGFEVLPASHPSAGRVVLNFELIDARAGKGVDASSAPWSREKAYVPTALAA